MMTRFTASVAAAALLLASPAFAAGTDPQPAQTQQQKDSKDTTTNCAEGAAQTADGTSCPSATAASPDDAIGKVYVWPAWPQEIPKTTGALPDFATG